MAAGRHGGYRDNEFRDRKTDYGTTRKEIGSLNGEYERGRKGSRDFDRGQIHVRGSLEYRDRVRQRDVGEREMRNGGHRSTSSRSDSGSSGGGPRRCGYAVRPVDREPGELSSDGSDGATEAEIQCNKETDVTILDNGRQLSPIQNKKRKFSPIVWDRDDKDATRTIRSTKVLESCNLPPLPPPPPLPVPLKSNSIHDDVEQTSLVEDNGVHVSGGPPSDIDSLPYVSELPGMTDSSLPKEEDRLNDMIAETNDENDYVPRTITSSRWANDAESPSDEGEISDYEDSWKMKRKSESKSAEAKVGRKSISPGLGEFSEGTKVRSLGSDERVRSSSRDSYNDTVDKNDYMEVDDDQNIVCSDASHSGTESEDDVGSHGTPEHVHPPQRSFNMLHGCRSVDEFERLNRIDEGTYGIVFRAKDKKTGEVVALKKVKMDREREGFPLTSLREINILLSIHHPSIVDVKEVVVGSNLDSIYMVMEYMEHDLKGLMETMKQPYSQSEVKCLMLQLLEGIKYLHDNWVLHRDLKTSNLLLNNCGDLKICDFGLARQYGSPLKPYTSLVVTLWYRAPELLLGAKQYSTAIDMWSLGCIMAELLSKEPLFNGKSEVEQLDKIFKILGTPNETIWPGLSDLPGAKVNFAKQKYNLLRKKFPATSFTGTPVLSDAGFDLLNELLTYDPEKRITADAALNHEWFREVPLPKSKEFMPTFPAQHAQDRRMRRVMKSPDPLEELKRKEKQGELGTGGLFGQ
ncbi:cyclin-dependent kinase G-2-like isoform X1 [Salvia splendens]|uniref:cyclin-dependent kinase G-2-like isoform X1 n=1 Tax=Salvia splendens TaxID=180675 RepID=UPI001C2601F4|nr:cyclin-dependent kinase G-2-like isoform X1 [Salvia splendens]XP_042057219.1 cyclin-dependent kinase G-2-like isoform X1 [Salvia splendens]XP_042057220.1 cyclin-dependent kinase G-2-like isoform X1 [Salvia splendens]XP_042057221.1 cyclin-dependent kinase G-2-like isoform X1 [Salvia splendens]XP_042057222.1 cyclin-dependent kinase G-2-like isoform X1 [Salvia splendens]